jgi:hypothetical protein
MGRIEDEQQFRSEYYQPRIHVLREPEGEDALDASGMPASWRAARYTYPIGGFLPVATLVTAYKQAAEDAQPHYEIITGLSRDVGTPLNTTPDPPSSKNTPFGYINLHYGFILTRLITGMKYRFLWAETPTDIALRGTKFESNAQGGYDTTEVEVGWSAGLRPGYTGIIYCAEFTATAHYKNIFLDAPPPPHDNAPEETYWANVFASVLASGRVLHPGGDSGEMLLPAPPNSWYTNGYTKWRYEGRCVGMSVGRTLQTTITDMPPDPPIGYPGSQITQHREYLSTAMEPAFSLFPNRPGYTDAPPPELPRQRIAYITI